MAWYIIGPQYMPVLVHKWVNAEWIKSHHIDLWTPQNDLQSLNIWQIPNGARDPERAERWPQAAKGVAWAPPCMALAWGAPVPWPASVGKGSVLSSLPGPQRAFCRDWHFVSKCEIPWPQHKVECVGSNEVFAEACLLSELTHPQTSLFWELQSQETATQFRNQIKWRELGRWWRQDTAPRPSQDVRAGFRAKFGETGR